MEKMRDLYREVILELNKNPICFKKNPEAQHIIEAHNPVCGDQYKIYFDVQDDVITNLSYHGYGCAISKASGSILMKMMGSEKSINEAMAVESSFQSVISGKQSEKIPEDFIAFISVHEHPGRLKCVTLVWDEMVGALQKLKKG